MYIHFDWRMPSMNDARPSVRELIALIYLIMPQICSNSVLP